MGKLFIGHYGEPPEAESVAVTLNDCHQRLGLKPSDFVSADTPSFFSKKHGAVGKYVVFQVDAQEIAGAAVWKPGYYLLPLKTLDVLKAFGKQAGDREGTVQRPVELEFEQPPPPDVLERAQRWANQSQPLLFQCYCPELLLQMDPPWGFRRRWKVRLTCKKRCQPPLKSEV